MWNFTSLTKKGDLIKPLQEVPSLFRKGKLPIETLFSKLEFLPKPHKRSISKSKAKVLYSFPSPFGKTTLF